MWICQNDLLDFQKCQTFALLVVTHHESTFQMGMWGNNVDTFLLKCPCLRSMVNAEYMFLLQQVLITYCLLAFSLA